MKIKHILGEEVWEKEVEGERTFLLGNDIGDYIWMADEAESRYQGWFFSPEKEKGKKLYKVIEDIGPVDRKEVEIIGNHFKGVERKRGDLIEKFFIAENSHALLYELSSTETVELVLDMRESYSDSYPDYHIEEVEEGLLISSSKEGEELFLAIKGFESFEKIEKGIVRTYQFDKERSSPPFEKAVFSALEMTGRSFLFFASESREEALSEINKEHKFNFLEEKKEPIDFVSAETGLDNLLVDGRRVYAGFPWFFQFWERDEAIVLRGLNVIDEKRARSLFWSLLRGNRTGPKENHLADSAGWIFKRAFLFINSFNQQEERELVDSLRQEVDFNPDEILKVTGPKETWMDSLPRQGARIEIQSLQLSMYKLGRLIDEENEEKYTELEEKLKRRVRNIFWDGSILADGYFPETDYLDRTIRPNIFLAYYIYPELLSDEEWKICFRRSLHELWLDWGGLASISRENPRFNLKHTGENSQSYHQGDSWFFVNNLAAIAMHRLDEGKFSYEINKILEASRTDMMWNGAVGHHSEVSSAEELRAEGAISQAWSFSTYLEALHEIFKVKNFNWN